MAKLILEMQCSLDGYVCGPRGELDWILPDMDAEYTAWTMERLWRASAHLMGGVAYRDMAAHWPTSKEPFAEPMNRIPKIVFSRTITRAEWRETEVIAGDVAQHVERLKRERTGELLAHGGVRFAQSLIGAGLVDAYRLVVHPVAPPRTYSTPEALSFANNSGSDTTATPIPLSEKPYGSTSRSPSISPPQV